MHTEPIRNPRTCRACHKHHCGYRTQRGRWAARRDHDICVRCWEELRDAAISEDMACRPLRSLGQEIALPA